MSVRAFAGVAVLAVACLSGCASLNPGLRPEATDAFATSPGLRAHHFRILSAFQGEYLHRLQIGEVEGLRRMLEAEMAMNVPLLWAVIQNPQVPEKERAGAYGLLRLMAIQNEKYPIAGIESDPEARKILARAIAENPAHADKLRRQDWTVGRWGKWVD